MTLQRIYYTFADDIGADDIHTELDLGTTIVDGWFVSAEIVFMPDALFGAGNTVGVLGFGMKYDPEDIQPILDLAGALYYDNPLEDYLANTNDAFAVHGSARLMPKFHLLITDIMAIGTAPAEAWKFKLIFRDGVKSHKSIHFGYMFNSLEGDGVHAFGGNVYAELCQVIAPNNWK